MILFAEDQPEGIRNYHAERPDLILMAITSQVLSPPAFGEFPVRDCQAAGLLKASVIKPVIATLEQSLVIKVLGQLGKVDCEALKHALANIVGSERIIVILIVRGLHRE